MCVGCENIKWKCLDFFFFFIVNACLLKFSTQILLSPLHTDQIKNQLSEWKKKLGEQIYINKYYNRCQCSHAVTSQQKQANRIFEYCARIHQHKTLISNVIELFSGTFAAVIGILIECINELAAIKRCSNAHQNNFQKQNIKNSHISIDNVNYSRFVQYSVVLVFLSPYIKGANHLAIFNL